MEIGCSLSTRSLTDVRAIEPQEIEGALRMSETYSKILVQLAQSGTVGIALLLGAAPSATASQQPADLQPAAAQGQRVSERLAAIRDAVSAAADTQTQAGEEAGAERVAQHWHNFRPWNNWHNFQPWSNWNNFRPWHNWSNFYR
jgi:hypothetical protein